MTHDMAATTNLPALPFESASPFDPAPLLMRLQAERPVVRVRAPVGDEGWLVTGYERVRDLLGDDRLGRAHQRHRRHRGAARDLVT